MPALQTEQLLQQPDGTTFTAKLWGDERAHGWETIDGYTIVKDPVTKYWHYVQTDATTTKMVAGAIVGAADATADLEKHQRPVSTKSLRSFEKDNTVLTGTKSVSGLDRTSPTGSRPVPVLMINYNDTSATYDAADFENLLFGTGTGSMKDYYEEVSYGAFTVTPGTSGVAGWYTAANGAEYYGQNDAFGYDQHPGELVREAVAAADASIDFSQYDSDGDCYVDAVVIVHQGRGEEAGGGADTIWSHSWNLNSARYYNDGDGQYMTNDVGECGRIYINDYVIQPEILYGGMQTIGVFAHEYGHVLGLPDLYDIDYSSNGIGNWGLMSGGAWGSVSRPGDSPVHMSAWSKYTLGWIDPVQITGTLTDEMIDPVSTFDDVYIFFPGNQIDSQEYYLIENRQWIGFDAGLPGTGMALWHVDEAKASYSNRDNAYECTPSEDCTNTHYRVALIQADGDWDLENRYNRGDSGDMFPGQSHNTQFSAATDPSNLLYDGSSSNLTITGIAESDQTITATFSIAYAVTPSVIGYGNISPGIVTTITPGDDITFTITPIDGYQISKVYVDGNSVGAVSEYTFDNIQTDHSIRAEFTSIAGTTTETNTSGGGGGGSGCFISSLGW